MIIGTNKFIANMGRIAKKEISRQRANMNLACMELQRLSVKEVPVATGNLRASKFLRVTGHISVKGIVGYTAVYATSVHENPRSGQTGGISPRGLPYSRVKSSGKGTWARTGKWKFLEDPLKNNEKRLLKIIGRKLV